ncbi:unnamed protein product, partial [Prorocentrum cordatum]
EFFALPPIPAKHLAPYGVALDGVEGESLLLPQVVALPMGFSWALHLCQTVLEASLGRAGFPQSDLILDGRCGCQLTSDLDSVAGAGYVDNYFVLGGSPKVVSERLQAIADDLTRHGLTVHELEPPSQDRDFLGPSLREGRWLSLRARNIWRLRAAIRATLRRQVISGFLLRVLTGHITWALLLRRELLCILGATYAYVEATGPVASPLWPAVRRELQLVHDLLPLCIADLGAPRRGRVACTDASPFGLGVVARRAPKDCVGTIGRVAERWRYKGDFGVSTQLVGDVITEGLPFEGVLGEASEGPVGLQLPRAPRATDKSIMDMRPVVDFDEVPPHFIRGPAWGSVAAVYIKGRADILALEGEALVLGHRHLLRSTSAFGSRFLILSDNLPLVLSVGKGRARSKHLQSTLRKICALSVATGSTLAVRWIPSEANPSDALSRGRAGWFSGSRPAPLPPGGGLLAHARASRAKALAAETAAVAGLSLLERLAARSSTARLYQGALTSFVGFCVERRLDWATHSGLDDTLVRYMDNEFLLGGGGNQGNVLLAAVAHFLGSFHKRTALLLPRAHRAAAAWARRAPGRTRLPLPRRVVFALAGLLVHDGSPRLAICILVMFASYLRPGEAAKLRGRHLIPPSEAAGAGYQFFGLLLHESGQEPGKTGVNDESILFDREAWLNPLLHALKQSTAPSEPLWGQEVDRLSVLFAQACRRLSLDRLRPHLHSLRHGGASDDMLSQRRQLGEIQRRGRWRTAKSLNRYTKETKLLDELAWIPPEVMELGAFVESNLEALVGGCLPNWLATGRVPAAAASLFRPLPQGRQPAARGLALRRRPVLELFCGAGRIAEALLARGVAAFGLDWQRSPLEDHVLPAFIATVVGWIR